MNTTTQIARHFRDVYFGGNWTASNLKDNLTDVTWQEATTRLYSFNTIATLVFHMNYYVAAVTKVLEGEPLNAKDEYSFQHAPVTSLVEWQQLVDKCFTDAQHFATLIEQLPEEKLWEDFVDPKYGNYYRNLHGIIEHVHYHLGQIALIKKLVRRSDANENL
jgi:uncharacterized damage-inducible protein DinB